ncbi:hypothetical protein V1477_012801 [Vespula maculifrons]|uniref:Uncharacterized protein n=1 Tax=Vespula maculifrons TaxID=7453 RepID=A0ABD2BU49_VESMC
MLHDRSCLEMSEADGVDSGAICKRGFIHLQFAEKPEAPEAERHLARSSRSGKASRFADFRVDSPLARGSQSAATSTRWDLDKITPSHSDIHVSVRARLKVLPGTSFYLFGDYLLTPVSRILESRVTVSSWVPRCSNLQAVGPGSSCFGLRRENIEIFADAIRASINEHLIQIYNSLFDLILKFEVGIIFFLCFGHRPVNLKNFKDAIRASINQHGDTRLREMTTMSGLWATFCSSWFSCALDFDQ